MWILTNWNQSFWQASAFVVSYPVNNVIDKESNETQKAVAWEKAFIQLVKVCSLCHFIFHCWCEFFSSHWPCECPCGWQEELLPMARERNLTLSFSSESSIEDELKRESTADAITILVTTPSSVWNFNLSPIYLGPFLCSLFNWLFFCISLFQISYLVMFAYISLTLGDTPRLSTFYISSKVDLRNRFSYNIAWIFTHSMSFLCCMPGIAGAFWSYACDALCSWISRIF